MKEKCSTLVLAQKFGTNGTDWNRQWKSMEKCGKPSAIFNIHSHGMMQNDSQPCDWWDWWDDLSWAL
jgi:hypothetical protein